MLYPSYIKDSLAAGFWLQVNISCCIRPISRIVELLGSGYRLVSHVVSVLYQF